MKRLYDKALMEQIARVYGNELTFLSEFSRALLDIIREGLIRDGQVRLHQFGTFKLKWMKARSGVNPATGEKMQINARPRVVFVPAKALKERVEPVIPALIPLDGVIKAEEQGETVTVAEKTVEFDLSAEAREQIDSLVEQAAPVNADAAVKESEQVAEEAPMTPEEPAVENFHDSEFTESHPELADESETTDELPGNEMPADNAVVEETLSELADESGTERRGPVVIGDIRDEIEVLEQVADILSTDSASNESSPLEEQEQIKRSESAITEEENFDSAFEEPDSVAATPVTESSQWLDNDVVNKIDELAEQEYLRDSDKAEQLSETEHAAETEADVTEADVIEADVIEAVQAQPADTAANESETTAGTGTDVITGLPVRTETAEKEDNSKRNQWIAIAASVLLFIAAAFMINNMLTGRDVKTESPLAEAVVPGQQTEAVTDVAAVPDSADVAEPAAVAETDETETTVSQADEPAVIETAQPEQSNATSDTVAETESAVTETEGTETDTVNGQQNVTENVASQSVPGLIDEAEVNRAIEQGVLVSEQNYDELKRATSEQDVFFAARDHRLVNGDSLWRLAKKHYVNPFFWPHIYQENHERIDNPDRVRIGRIITLPTLFGPPDNLTRDDRRNIAMGYYYNYLYHKQKGDPQAYFSLIGVDKFYPELLIEFKEVIGTRDVNNLAMLME